MSYVALIRRESASEFLVTFPDVPEALTSGVTLEEARAAAPDALWTALVGYVEAGLPLPARSEFHRADARAGVEWLDVPVDLSDVRS